MPTEDAPHTLTLEDFLAHSGFAGIMAHRWNRIPGSLILFVQDRSCLLQEVRKDMSTPRLRVIQMSKTQPTSLVDLYSAHVVLSESGTVVKDRYGILRKENEPYTLDDVRDAYAKRISAHEQPCGVPGSIRIAKPSETLVITVADEAESEAVQGAFFALNVFWRGRQRTVEPVVPPGRAICYHPDEDCLGVGNITAYKTQGYKIVSAADFLGGEMTAPQEEPVRKCTCDLTELLRFGCRCGGV